MQQESLLRQQEQQKLSEESLLRQQEQQKLTGEQSRAASLVAEKKELEEKIAALTMKASGAYETYFVASYRVLYL